MGLTAYVRLLDEDTEIFSYEDTSLPIYGGFEFKLGSAMLSLLDLDTERIAQIYSDMLEEVFQLIVKADYGFLDLLRPKVNRLDADFPGLYFHTHLLYYCVGDLFSKETFDIREDFLELWNGRELIEGMSYPDLQLYGNAKDKKTVQRYFEYAVEAVMQDITYWKEEVSQEAAYLYEYEQLEEYRAMRPEQRLFFLDHILTQYSIRRKFKFTEISFNTMLMKNDTNDSAIVHEPMLQANAKKLAEAVLKADVSLSEVYVLKSLQDWLRFDLFKMVLADLPIVKCNNCGRFFIPRGRRSAKYCNRVAQDETLPCEAIGAIRVYQNKVADDPIFIAFSKAYKRMNSRVKYKNMTQTEFYAWSESARKMREKCQKGDISLEEFILWLGNKK